MSKHLKEGFLDGLALGPLWRVAFQRSGGHWLFWSGFLYLSLTALVAFSPYSDYTMLVQLVWLVMVALPLMCNPLARWLNMKETHMFDLFKKKSNVVQFPDVLKTEVKTPYTLPEPEKPVTTYYRLGITSNGRVSFQMGYSEITMNAGGVDNMIAQLEVFRDQVIEYEDSGPEDDPDGGEPVPVPENKQKAA
jgi:hypothetical protein